MWPINAGEVARVSRPTLARARQPHRRNPQFPSNPHGAKLLWRTARHLYPKRPAPRALRLPVHPQIGACFRLLTRAEKPRELLILLSPGRNRALMRAGLRAAVRLERDLGPVRSRHPYLGRGEDRALGAPRRAYSRWWPPWPRPSRWRGAPVRRPLSTFPAPRSRSFASSPNGRRFPDRRLHHAGQGRLRRQWKRRGACGCSQPTGAGAYLPSLAIALATAHSGKTRRAALRARPWNRSSFPASIVAGVYAALIGPDEIVKRLMLRV